MCIDKLGLQHLNFLGAIRVSPSSKRLPGAGAETRYYHLHYRVQLGITETQVPRSIKMFLCPPSTNFGQKCSSKSAYSRHSWIRDKLRKLIWFKSQKFERAHLSQDFCLKGAHLRQILIWFIGQFLLSHPQTVRNCDIRLTRKKCAYYVIITGQMCPLKQLCAPRHGGRGGKNNGPGHVQPLPCLGNVFSMFLKCHHVCQLRWYIQKSIHSGKDMLLNRPITGLLT